MSLISQKISPFRKPRKPGDLQALKRKLWWAIVRTEDLLDDLEASPDIRLRAANGMAQLSAVYLRLLEGSDLEARLAALEAEVARPGPRRIG